MIRSMNIASRNFNVLRLKQENLSANAANVTTPGYKYQKIVQQTLPTSVAMNQKGGARRNQPQVLGDFSFGNQVDAAVTVMSGGSLGQTTSSTDLALIGDGFFTVNGPNGVMYTKNGQFSVNEAGQLVTAEGYRVQTTGNVVFDQNTRIDQNGYINGTNAQLVISSFAGNTDNLTVVEGSYFTGAGAVQNNGEAVLYQGYLEAGNIDLADIMVEMMEITREYEATQKVLHASNETLQKATNQVGKV